MNTKQFEKNVVESFKLAKSDIYNLYENVKYLLEEVDYLKKESAYLKAQIGVLSKKKRTVKVRTAKKVARKVVKRKFVGTKSGSKVHDTGCPFAKNIMPKNKVLFASKVKALNEGYKLCKCLN